MGENHGNQDNADRPLMTVATIAAFATGIMTSAYLWNDYFDESVNFADYSGASTSAKSQR